MRLFVIYTLIGISSSLFGQQATEIRDNVKIIVDSISKNNIYTDQFREGNIAIEQNQYKRFLRLKNQATTEELISLTSHANPVVRCYSFQALPSNQDSLLFLLPLVLPFC